MSPTPSDMSSAPLARLVTDSTLRLPATSLTAGESAVIADALMPRLERSRSLLGSGVDEQIPSAPALAHSAAADTATGAASSALIDTPLAAALASLDLTGDLAPYGWRVGVGDGLALHAARDHANRLLDAARIALFGFDGPLTIQRPGSVALAAAVFTASGERALGDPGLLRDLPHLLAGGLARETAQVRERVPGAALDITLDERGLRAVQQGRIRTASGYRFHPPVGRDAITRHLATVLTSSAEPSTAQPRILIDAHTDLVDAARSAGAERIGLDPLSGQARRPGRLWELLADARDRGVGLTFVLAPGREEKALSHVLSCWRELGFAPREARGFDFLLSRGSARRREQSLTADQALSLPEIEQGMRMMLRWGERLEA